MKDSNSIYSFSLGAIITNLGFPFEYLSTNDFILLLIFVSKTFLAGFLSVLSTDAFIKIKNWVNKKIKSWFNKKNNEQQ